MQYVDFCLLDVQTLAYKNRTLAAAFMYLTLVLRLDMYSLDSIVGQFRGSSQFIRAEN